VELEGVDNGVVAVELSELEVLEFLVVNGIETDPEPKGIEEFPTLRGPEET
jgi:hypothetical protein